MHDPLTQAFSVGRWLTIWHRDPLRFENKICRRDDDSCGWFTPPYSQAQRDAIKKLSGQQYGEIFAKQVAEREEKSYAYICNEPDCHSAIYWSWRAIKHLYRPHGVWQWGCKLTASEKEHIYSLATCPVDNLLHVFREVKDEMTFGRFFFLVFAAYIRHARPWYRHPRWHVWHWRIQIHPIQQFKRWAFSRCGTCGNRFSWGYSPTTHSWDGAGPQWFRGEHDVHHSNCLGHAIAATNSSDGEKNI